MTHVFDSAPPSPSAFDTAFQIAASNLRFGAGCTAEIGSDLVDLRAERVLLVIDPALVPLPTGQIVRRSLVEAGLKVTVYDRILVEPTDKSFLAAAEFAQQARCDAIVAVGGGSTLDTAKAANLYTSWPAELLEYVNAPIGKGRPVPGPLRPLVAVPTTAGTGSETTGVAIFDLVSHRAKTGIAHRYLKPTLAIVDPENTRTQPLAVAASSGSDVLSHALESYTAIPYTARPRPARPLERPAYQGANPISDVWALKALELVNHYLLRAVRNRDDDEARAQMLLASSIAGIGFGNAGVHLPHGMSYPVAAQVKDFRPTGYEVTKPLIPHGISVIMHTPAVVRFTAPTSPERHLRAAEALGADVAGVGLEQAGEVLSDRVRWFIRELRLPNGLGALGYTTQDIPDLVTGTLPQHRVTKLSPRGATERDLADLFEQSLRVW